MITLSAAVAMLASAAAMLALGRLRGGRGGVAIASTGFLVGIVGAFVLDSALAPFGRDLTLLSFLVIAGPLMCVVTLAVHLGARLRGRRGGDDG